MFSSKQEVDRHVRSTFERIKDEKERKKRSFPVARMYYGVKEYEMAKKYLTAFLSENENYPAAHKLMGQIFDAQGKQEKAVDCYKKSLQQDGNQKDVLLKICELYSQLDIDPERAKYWVERAEKHFPHHDVVFKLREMIYANGELETNSDDLENLIAAQLAKEPKDVKLRMRLLRLYIDTNRVNEAYEHAFSVEKKAAHQDSLEWYRCLHEILQVYQEESGRNVNGVYHKQLLSVLNNLARLSLEKAKVIDCTEVLCRFDGTLLSCSNASDSEEWKEYYQEMKSQFLFHAGTLLLKRAQQDQLNWREASDMTAACYLASWSTEPPTTRTSWFSKASPEEKRVLEHLKATANYRASQTGHMLELLKKGDATKWMQKIRQKYFTQQGKEKLFDALLFDSLFTPRNTKGRKDQSFLVNSNVLLDVTVSFPTKERLREYDLVAHLLYPDCLAGLVWLALQRYSVKSKVQPNYEFHIYESLPFSTQNLKSASAETLCQIDTQAFLYGVVWCAAQELEERRSVLQLGTERPLLLPSALSRELCSVEQNSWWSAAYTLCTNSAKEKLAQLRQTLQRGLEVLRLLGNHCMDASILITIAQAFAQQVEEMKENSRKKKKVPTATLRTTA